MIIEHAQSFFAWNVSAWLFLVMVVSFVIVVVDRIFFKKKNINDVKEVGDEDKSLIEKEKTIKDESKSLVEKIVYFICFLKFNKAEKYKDRPSIVRWAADFYPVLLLVFLLRGFIVEPFKIPSSSMMPTLLTGDFVLVNKFAYDIKLPILNSKIISISEPQRGDIVVFRYPNYEKNPQYKGADFIKRVIAIPGDKISYYFDHLSVNDKKILYKDIGIYKGVGSSAEMTGFRHKSETLYGSTYDILLAPNNISRSIIPAIEVPPLHYFVMGDNRSRSSDSRFWGFVPKEYIIGKTFAIWFHIDWDLNYPQDIFKLSRVGSIK